MAACKSGPTPSSACSLTADPATGARGTRAHDRVRTHRDHLPAPAETTKLPADLMADELPEIPPDQIQPALQSFFLGVDAIRRQLARAGQATQLYARVAEQSVAALAPAMEPVLRLSDTIRERLAAAMPPNWDPDTIRFRGILDVALEDGIPIVWVPRAEVVAALMKAPARPDRIQILLDHVDQVRSDCRTAVRTCTHPDLADRVPLALDALRTHGRGSIESAQAMAVLVAEGLATEFIAGGYAKGVYDKLAKLAANTGRAMPAEMRTAVTIAPMKNFFEKWYPTGGRPRVELSRHVSVHRASAGHYTAENSLLAIMLMSSLLRELQQQHQPTPYRVSR